MYNFTYLFRSKWEYAKQVKRTIIWDKEKENSLLIAAKRVTEGSLFLRKKF